MWAISEFLRHELATSGRRDTARALADRLDAGNRNKAFRRVHRLLDDGECPPALAARLEALFPGRQEALRAALRATEEARRERLRLALAREQARADAAFKPHLFLRTERSQPSQITIFAFANGVRRWLMLPLPESIGERPWPEQKRTVREAVQAHIAEKGRDRPVPFMGNTVSYLYRPRPGSSFRVTLDGRLQGPDLGRFTQPSTSVSLRR